MSSETNRPISESTQTWKNGSNKAGRRRINIWAWIIFIIGMIYFFLPLISTFIFSLSMIKDQYTFEAYRQAFSDPKFYQNFGYSFLWAIITIISSVLLVVPTAYWVHWRHAAAEACGGICYVDALRGASCSSYLWYDPVVRKSSHHPDRKPDTIDRRLCGSLPTLYVPGG